jgi:hypothetical protein
VSRKQSNQEKFDDLRETLRGAISPFGQPELRRDLWPLMLRRLEKPAIGVSWLDWTLLALTGATLAFFPVLIPALLYHL